MQFERKYIDFGKITFTNCSVSVFCDLFHCRNLSNLPCSGVANAYWQGNHINVETPDGYVFVYEGFENSSYRWHK